MAKEKECRELENHFFEKFKLYPVIKHRRTQRGDFYYTLQLEGGMTVQDNFYHMGQSLDAAHRYIDMLFRVPNGTITFTSLSDREDYKETEVKNASSV